MASNEKHQKMSQTANDANLGDRIGWWARMAWPGSRAKNLANMLGISESQAKRIIGGAAPTSEQMAIMAKAWGWRFIDFVFEGLAGPIPPVRVMYKEMETLDARVRQLEQERRAEDARPALSAMANTRLDAAQSDPASRLVRTDEAQADPVAAPSAQRRRG